MPADVPGPGAGDVRDVVARMRAGALDTAATAYTATYGHPLEHPSPDAPTGPRRWQLSLRLAVVAAIAVAVLCAGVVARATLTAPAVPVVAMPVVAAPEPNGSPTAGGPAALPRPGDPASADVVVHVIGQVAAPGVVRLPPGSRVVDAVQAAGGPGPGADLAGLNLARAVEDGEQIVVPTPGEVAAGQGAPTEANGGAGGGATGDPAEGGADRLIDLNTADLSALDALPGIGPVLAQRIVDWRAEHGRFTAVEELGEVAGIGETLFGRLRDLVRV